MISPSSEASEWGPLGLTETLRERPAAARGQIPGAQIPASRTSVAAAAAISCSEAHSRTRVELVAAGEQVRGGQPHLGEQRPVGAAADRLLDRLQTLRADGGLGRLRRRPVRDPAHSRMLRYCSRISTSTRARGSRAATSSAVRAQQLRVPAQPRFVEVAQDEDDAGPRRGAGDLERVDEPLAAGGRLGREAVGGQRGDDLSGEPQRVDHLAGRAWPGWTSTPVTVSDRLVGGERLVLEPADVRAVERVGAQSAPKRSRSNSGARPARPPRRG